MTIILKRFLLFFVGILLFNACQKKIEGFDDVTWRADHKGCQGTREKMAELLIEKKELVKNLDDNALASLLGDPERNRQLTRGKKNYIYFIQPGNQCQGDSSLKEGKKLIIEFDALGFPRVIRTSYIDF